MRADAGGGMPVQPGVLTFSAAVEADYRLKGEPGPAPEKAAPAPAPPAVDAEDGEAAPPSP